ncbi:hypothetical protein BC828DRAFT_391215 [Blastocladiella britannica]|nr:hypothetical protein BC828DRAFT_391215 [Blastocladiella britannica]
MSSAAVPAAPQRPRPKRAKRSLLRKLADMVSPPSASPKALLPAPPLAPAAPKPPSVLDFDAELPDTELAGIARTADETTHMIAGAGGKLLKAAELFASAQEKLAGNEKFEMIGAVFGHLQGIVATVPFAGPIFTCFKVYTLIYCNCIGYTDA